jgi:hypothetical protein
LNEKVSVIIPAKDEANSIGEFIAQELGYFSQSQSISSLLITIDKLSLKLNNLISSTRKLNKKAQ